MLIIKIEAESNGFHALQSQSHRTECWLDGYIEVPKDLENEVMACGGYCELSIKDEVLIDITPLDKPEPERPVSEVEQLRADIDYIAIMTGVEL